MNGLTHTLKSGPFEGLTMSSLEIAELTAKEHKNVIRDIRTMIVGLYGSENDTFETLRWDGSELSHIAKSVTWAKDSRGYLASFSLDKEHTVTLVAGYDVKLRKRIIDRWMELEAAAAHRTNQKLDAREARLTFTNFVRLGRLLKLDGNQAILSANKATREIVGIDMLSAMGVTHLVAPTDNASLTPTTIGQQIGGMSARSVNEALSRHGYQTSFRDAKGHLVYEPTEKGRSVGGYMTDTGKRHSNGTPVRQLMWTTQSMGALRADLQMETA